MIVSVFTPASQVVRRSWLSTLAGNGWPEASVRLSSPTSRMSSAPSLAGGGAAVLVAPATCVPALTSASALVVLVSARNRSTVYQATPVASSASADTSATAVR